MKIFASAKIHLYSALGGLSFAHRAIIILRSRLSFAEGDRIIHRYAQFFYIPTASSPLLA